MELDARGGSRSRPARGPVPRATTSGSTPTFRARLTTCLPRWFRRTTTHCPTFQGAGSDDYRSEGAGTETHRPVNTNPKALVSALPALSTATVYAWPVVTGGRYFPGTNLDLLSGAMRIEWLVLAAGLFCIPLLAIPARKTVVKMVFFALFAWAFAQGAWHMDGLRGLSTFAILLMASYGGSSLFIRDEMRRNVAGIMALVRFVVIVFVFFPLVVLFGIGEGDISGWRGDWSVVQFGAAFFSILSVLELTLFAWLRSARVSRVFESMRS